MNDELRHKIRRPILEAIWWEKLPAGDWHDQFIRLDNKAAKAAADVLTPVVAAMLAEAWQEGFKQGGPMHDVNYDDPDAHKRNPYRT